MLGYSALIDRQALSSNQWTYLRKVNYVPDWRSSWRVCIIYWKSSLSLKQTKKNLKLEVTNEYSAVGGCWGSKISPEKRWTDIDILQITEPSMIMSVNSCGIKDYEGWVPQSKVLCDLGLDYPLGLQTCTKILNLKLFARDNV